ncbi:MAG: ABC transporter permease [Candidatus Dormibacteraeota bacterium]|jgi:peptide/nickel transport system permease protein|nr:ABC transporter permease [Candidatus Dormibacteraeota bacterium]
MTAYLIRRALHALIVLFGVSLIVFLLLHLLPGGPARASLGLRANPASIRAFDQQYGLNQPLPVQYLVWIGQVLRGNLGFSYKLNQSVDSLLAENVPRTLVLMGTATIIAVAIAIPVGMLQAVKRNSPGDYTLTALAFLFYSMPSFLLGLVLIIVFSDVWPVLPSTGPTATSPLFDQIPNLILPVATLALITVALFSRYMRSSALDNLAEDYVRTAAAKGVSRRAVLFRHVLPNALLPIITLVGLSLPGILGGALIVESLFNYPGMGLLFWNAAQTEDFPVMLGTSLVVGMGVVLGSLVADVLYGIADPRIRYQ